MEDDVVGWKLDREQRVALLLRFAPAYPYVVADHVTLASRVSPEQAPPGEVEAAIVGEADDGEGVQALVVSIDGATARPDGSTYHITWSLDRERGRRAVESNAVIARLGWRALPNPVPLRLIPARFGWDRSI